MESIRAEHRTADEVIETLLTALAKTIVLADLSAEQVKAVKRSLDSAIEFQRALDGQN
jgi:hypothetical protein